jgi:hypothetical protein
MNEALESATSLPDPIAIETSAAAIAYVPAGISCQEGNERFRTHWRIVYAISNHGDHTTIIQSFPKQLP